MFFYVNAPKDSLFILLQLLFYFSTYKPIDLFMYHLTKGHLISFKCSLFQMMLDCSQKCKQIVLSFPPRNGNKQLQFFQVLESDAPKRLCQLILLSCYLFIFLPNEIFFFKHLDSCQAKGYKANSHCLDSISLFIMSLGLFSHQLFFAFLFL